MAVLVVLAQGQVLNLTSAWWMRRTEHIVPNALLAVPDPNVAIMRRCTVFPVEFVVRGFMTGALADVCRACIQSPLSPCSHACFRHKGAWLASRLLPSIVLLATCCSCQDFWSIFSNRAVAASGLFRQHRHLAVDALRGRHAAVLRQRLPRRHAQEQQACTYLLLLNTLPLRSGASLHRPAITKLTVEESLESMQWLTSGTERAVLQPGVCTVLCMRRLSRPALQQLCMHALDSAVTGWCVARLQQSVLTPTTKAADHDEPIAPADIVARGLMSQAHWDTVRSAHSPPFLDLPCVFHVQPAAVMCPALPECQEMTRQ